MREALRGWRLITDHNDVGIPGCHVFVGGPRYWDGRSRWPPAGRPSRAREHGSLTLTDGAVAYVGGPTPTPTRHADPRSDAHTGSHANADPRDRADVGSSWEGEHEGDLTPPDPTGAIGPSSYIELTNLRYQISQRMASLVNSGDLGALTGLPVYELSDPQVVWDPARNGTSTSSSTSIGSASPSATR